MPPTDHHRTGRRPGKPDTRARIVQTARELISQSGGRGATMRAIAREAGVDSALVVHYFGSRSGLLREALRPSAADRSDVETELAGGLDGIGERLVRSILRHLDAEDGGARILRTVLAMGLDDAVAAETLHELITTDWTGPLAAALTEAGHGRDASLRAELAGTLLLSLTLSWTSPIFDEIRAADRETLVARYGALLQQALTG